MMRLAVQSAHAGPRRHAGRNLHKNRHRAMLGVDEFTARRAGGMVPTSSRVSVDNCDSKSPSAERRKKKYESQSSRQARVTMSRCRGYQIQYAQQWKCRLV